MQKQGIIPSLVGRFFLKFVPVNTTISRPKDLLASHIREDAKNNLPWAG